MDQSYSESDLSHSPTQILERLQVLRQLQLFQRGKLQKQRLDYQETSENSSNFTEIVSQFSNSTSYNTFRSLLETANDSSNEGTPRSMATNISSKDIEKDLIDGVSILNLSQESEFIVNSPVSARSAVSITNKHGGSVCIVDSTDAKLTAKKQISLDDMPVLTPTKDFEALILEKLKGEANKKVTKSVKNTIPKAIVKKPFLRKGEGISRFGLQKSNPIIQNTNSLPWKKNNIKTKANLSKEEQNVSKNDSNKVDIKIFVTDNDNIVEKQSKVTVKMIDDSKINGTEEMENNRTNMQTKDKNLCDHSANELSQNIIQLPKDKHTLLSNKGKTWASVLSKEQSEFLHQLKQSEYYKNFASPAKSTISDASCDENLLKLRTEREMAEQNMFELLESKVSHESFSLENTFFNKFLRRSQFECSGESTPLVMQQCLAKNPNLIKILPNIYNKKRHEVSHSDVDTNGDCSDCCSDTCSSVSSCCSCKTVEEKSMYSDREENKQKNKTRQKEKIVPIQKRLHGDKVTKIIDTEKHKSDNVREDTEMKANMVEMNAKLIATSELLKERLHELEDEIETFRKENANLTKMRDEIDAERHKFYEEKSVFEQKFNEEKILSEYYMAEEKEKLNKQKQMYEKYVREMRGRLNKKDKDEVVHLKNEIKSLKEEMRLKEAKTTSTIARLRNQIKIFEKEKKECLEEIEKLKKENRRIQHSNDMTRRMTNIKYLEEINKKLSNMTAKDTKSEINLDSNAKYKTFEIERQSRPRKVQAATNKIRSRAKSVPNLKVTSTYAKYFSQRDVVSDVDKNKMYNTECSERYTCSSDNYQSEDELQHVADESEHYTDSEHEDNNLEKLYMERFHTLPPKRVLSNLSISSCKLDPKSERAGNSHRNPDNFFISKSMSNNELSLSNNVSPINNSSESDTNRSRQSSMSSHRSVCQRPLKNPIQGLHTDKINTADQILNASNGSSKSHNLSKSPVSILTNRSSSSHKPTTVIHKDYFRDTFSVSPEPISSRSSSSKTNLNPTEIKKPDGSKELRFPNGNTKFISSDGKYSKFVYYNGDIKENFYNEGRIKYFYAETKTCHTTHADGLEVLEFPDGQVEKRYKDGSTEIRLPNGSIRYFDPKNEHVREEWRFPDGTALTVSAAGEQRIVFSNGQVEVHAKDHKRREFPDGTVKLVYNDGTSETRYASGRVRIKDKHGSLIMDSASR